MGQEQNATLSRPEYARLDTPDEQDPWVLLVRLDRVEHDLERERQKTAYWKDAAQTAFAKQEAAETRLAETEKQIDQLGMQISHRDSAIAELQAAQQQQLSASHTAKVVEGNDPSDAARVAEDLRAALDARQDDIAKLGEALAREKERRQSEIASLGQLLDNSRRKLVETERALEQKSAELHEALETQNIRDVLGATRDTLNAALANPLAFRQQQRARNKINEDMRLIEASGLFDAQWYVQRYPDLAGGKISPLRHFVRYGAYELRDPGPDFSSEKYHKHNPDVTAHGMAGLVHYVRSGKSEGREIFKPDDTQ